MVEPSDEAELDHSRTTRVHGLELGQGLIQLDQINRLLRGGETLGGGKRNLERTGAAPRFAARRARARSTRTLRIIFDAIPKK
jgi:hypothetical protein